MNRNNLPLTLYAQVNHPLLVLNMYKTLGLFHYMSTGVGVMCSSPNPTCYKIIEVKIFVNFRIICLSFRAKIELLKLCIDLVVCRPRSLLSLLCGKSLMFPSQPLHHHLHQTILKIISNILLASNLIQVMNFILQIYFSLCISIANYLFPLINHTNY